MWSQTDEAWLGVILRELNSGKTIGALLLETTSWSARAKLLTNLAKVKKAFKDFQNEISS